MVHTSSDHSVLVAGKLLAQHGGHSHSKRELRSELLLTVIVISVISVAFHSIHMTVGLFSDFAYVSKDTTNTLIFCLRETFAFCLTFAIFGSTFQPPPVLSSYVCAVQPH